MPQEFFPMHFLLVKTEKSNAFFFSTLGLLNTS